MSAHAAGSVPLTVDGISEIEVWMAIIQDEYDVASARRFGQYVVHPPFDDVRDANTGVRRFRRFSCTGFVLDAHRQVGIELLVLDEAVLPELSESDLVSAYPEITRVPAELPAKLGVHGEGPWRVVHAGYVRHALNRPSDAIRAQPHRARPTDSRF